MAEIFRINSKQQRRPHHIEEWAEHRGLKQADIARELGADRSIVSRWFGGSTPGEEYQERLAALFGLDDVEALFRSPGEDWIASFLRGRSNDEIERIKSTLETAFPRKRA